MTLLERINEHTVTYRRTWLERESDAAVFGSRIWAWPQWRARSLRKDMLPAAQETQR